MLEMKDSFYSWGSGGLPYCDKHVVVVVDQFWHFIAAYELFVLFFSSVLSSCTLSHVASLRMRRIFNSLDRSPLAASSSNSTICAEGSHQGETTPIVPNSQLNVLVFFFFFSNIYK